MLVQERTTCRVCGSPGLTTVIDLGGQHLQGSFVKPGKESPPLDKFPSQLVLCDPALNEKACGLLQLRHSVAPELLYSNYWYRSGTNATMTNHLASIARDAAAMIGRADAQVLDIGCNDGTLLRSYPATFRKFGVDPSDIAKEITDEDITVVSDTFPSEQLLGRDLGGSFDIVTSIAMFYDLEDPVEFCRAIGDLLSPGGIWILEMSYMPLMLELNSYDTICHEHLEYYSLSAVENIFRRAGLKLVDVSFNDINGGSFRCYVTHAANDVFDSEDAAARLRDAREKEDGLDVNNATTFTNFQKRIEKHRDELRDLLVKLKAEGNRIHIYGASTKGNTILQFCGIDNTVIDMAAERSPEKFGARTLGTDIPIVSEAESRAVLPDYYLVLPWHFRAEFLEREKDMLAKGVGFIFPLPVIEVVR